MVLVEVRTRGRLRRAAILLAAIAVLAPAGRARAETYGANGLRFAADFAGPATRAKSLSVSTLRGGLSRLTFRASGAARFAVPAGARGRAAGTLSVTTGRTVRRHRLTVSRTGSTRVALLRDGSLTVTVRRATRTQHGSLAVGGLPAGTTDVGLVLNHGGAGILSGPSSCGRKGLLVAVARRRGAATARAGVSQGCAR